MKPDFRGLAKPGASARTLGARGNIDIPVNEDGFVEPGMGGMSVSPATPDNLPPWRRPPEFGGTGKDPLWELETDHWFSKKLVYRDDPDAPNRHGFIEPSQTMPFEEYQQALQYTRLSWVLAHPLETYGIIE